MKTLARPDDKAEIIQRLKAVRPDSVRRWGRMSPHQMICHLTDSMRVMTGEKPVRPPSNLLNQTIVKWIALYGPMRWPPGIPTIPELDQQLGGGTPPADFASDVAKLVALMNGVTAQTKARDSRIHPIFGRMSEAAWFRWAYLHADHHLRQFGA